MTDLQDDQTPLSALRDDSKLRRQTFERHWPPEKSFIPIDELVREGFYCMDAGSDRVQCTFCRGIIRNWVKGDDVFVEHRRLFPQCPYVKSVYRSPQYSDWQPRMDTFTDWPSQLRQQPRQMSKAGFFYVGIGDKVQCFWCGMVLKDWEPNDDPVLEHVRWASTCGWIVVLKGTQFIQDVLQVQAEPVPVRPPVEDDPLERAGMMGYTPHQIEKAVDRLHGSTFDLQLLLETIMDMELVPVVVPEDEPRGPDLTPPEPTEITSPHLLSGAQTSVPHHPQAPFPRDASIEDIELHSLSKENFALKRRTQCKICMEEDVCVVFMPCGHLVCCFSCGSLLNECPICRAQIHDKVRIFW